MGNQKNIVRDVVSFILFGLSFFSFFALITFQQSDPLVSSGFSAAAKNSFGKFGATFSLWSLKQFGICAFFIPILSLRFFYYSLMKGKKASFILDCLGLVGMATSLMVFFDLQVEGISFGGGQILVGGLFGQWGHQRLEPWLNGFGLTVLSLWMTGLSFSLLSVFHLRWALRLGGQFLKVILVALGWALVQSAPRFARTTSFCFQVFRGVLRRGLGPFGAWTSRARPAAENQVKPLHLREFQEAQDLFLREESAPLVHFPRAVLPSEQQPSENSKRISNRFIQPSKGGLRDWKVPPLDFLKKPTSSGAAVDRSRLLSNSQILRKKFADFGIEGEITAVRPGPVITLYEFKPGPGVKVSRIAALSDDLSMALSARSVRILAPLPGKSVIGIEIPSDVRETVFFSEFIKDKSFYSDQYSIPVVMGKDISGQPVLSDLARMPHLLCAGQTGSGKSVFMNGLICSFLYRFTPRDLRLILVDPKFIEFRAYQDVPHLLLPVVDDPQQAHLALKWAVREMERRYRILARLGARNLAAFNQKVQQLGADQVSSLLHAAPGNGAEPSAGGSVQGRDWQEAFEWDDERKEFRIETLPYIVIVIDELADLMMTAKKEVELSIARIAQKARAAGIHLIIATQRPSTDVVTGLIKANLPSRVSFQLASFVDSKTILDRAGAERLLGQGDMLFIPPGVSSLDRLHGAYVDDDEISKITEFLKAQGRPRYRQEILLAEAEDEELNSGSAGEGGSNLSDPLFQEAWTFVQNKGQASASLLQRAFKIGYNRAARMIEVMEEKGYVGPADGAKPREIYVQTERERSSYRDL
jgi:S-DNA-T family DNA segregation ATPase FtsK/SpoIIIE